MMLKLFRCKYSILLLLFLTAITFSQVKDSIKEKNEQLSKVRNEISKLEEELRFKSKKEKESLQSLENINKQNLLLSRLINNLLADEKQKENAIKNIETEIQNVEQHISVLKEQYAKYIVWLYKNRGLSMLRFIFNAESFNQALIRYQYLKYISKQNQLTLNKLLSYRMQLTDLQQDLEGERRAKEILAIQKQDEQATLDKKEEEKKNLISVLKSDQKVITEEISLKRRAEIIIKSIIAKLIEAEREIKKKALEKKDVAKRLPQFFDYNTFENFVQLKGNLSWPVREGKIVRNFGENRNERLNTVTLNYGIDLAVNPNASVHAVAEGVVSAIDWIPGYGSILILTHRDDYRTVYGHIANISVKEGERIKAGSLIGKVNESLEGNIIHFEIWNERNYQNPEVWLAKK
jgi:murein hydrolase activator